MLRPICEIVHFTKWASILPISRNGQYICPFREMGKTLAYLVNWAVEKVPISRIGQMLWTKFIFSFTNAGNHAKGVAVWHGSFLSLFHRLHSVQDQGCYYGLIGSRIRAFDWCQIHRIWTTLNGRNAPLAEIDKKFGAHQKNFNEDRPTLSAAKCRPAIVVSKNIKYMWICVAYYRAMLRRARLWDCMSAVRLWRWGMIFTQVGILRK